MITFVADHAGVGRTSLFRVMAGRSSPTLQWLEKIADALDCDVADLVAKAPHR